VPGSKAWFSGVLGINLVIAWAISSILVCMSVVDRLDKLTVLAVESVLLTMQGESSLSFSLSSLDISELWLCSVSPGFIFEAMVERENRDDASFS
jgi:hypothetical protein